MVARILAFLQVGLAFIPVLFGQSLPYRRYTIHDGLVQQQALCIYQDTWGYLWIGTFGGVSKFDGEKFENFSLKNGLPSLTVRRITEDTEGNIWIVTKGGLCKYDGIEWKAFPHEEMEFNWQWWEDILVGNLTKYRSLVFKDSIYKSIKNIFPQFSDVRRISLAGTKTYPGKPELFFQNKGEVDTLYFFDGKTLTFNVPSMKMFDIADSPRGKLVMVRDSLQGKYYLYDPHFVQLVDSVVFEKTISERRTFLMENGDWYFIVSSQLYHKKRGESRPEKINIPLKQPWQVLKDQSGEVLWVCDENGLVKIFLNGFEKAPQEVAPFPWSMVEDEQGNIWVGNYDFYLSKFDGKLNVRKFIFKDHWWQVYYLGACKDSRGNLYFPIGNGLIRFDGSTFTNLLEDIAKKSLSDGFGELIIRTSYYDSVDKKIIAAKFRGGLLLIDEQWPQNITPLAIETGSLSILSIARDRDSNYWFGKLDGLVKYHIPSGVFEYFLEDLEKPAKFSINSIFIDKTGMLWAGGWAGLSFFDKQKNELVPVAQNIIQSTVNNITGNDSLLLIGAADGIYAMNLDMWHKSGIFKIKHYNHLNGFQGIETVINASLIDSKGNY